MKEISKLIVSMVITGMVLTVVPFNAFANDNIPTRLAGVTAEQTAMAIAEQTGWTGTAILAPSVSYGMCDALSVGPLATSLKAPILLQGSDAELNREAKYELVKLNVTKVYVTSGTAVIKQSVIDEIKAMDIEVVSLGGFDKYETSVNIAKQMTGVTKVAIVNSIPDALSIAPIASVNNEPILLTDKDKIPASVQAYLASTTGSAITSSDIIGGTGVISDEVRAKLPSPTRHWGNTRYETNGQVIKDFASTLNFGQVYIANGVTGIDALAGAPLAAMTNSPIVLTDGVNAISASYTGKISTVSALYGAADGNGDGTGDDALNDKITVTLSPPITSSTSYGVTTALGGTAVVSDAIRVSGGIAITTPKITDFTVTASGKAVTPTMLYTPYAGIVFTVSKSDQPVEYSVSYKGGDPVTSNIQASSTAPINVKVGQSFNVISGRFGNPTYDLIYVPNNDPITLIKETRVPVGPPGVSGLGGTSISTFQATQTGSFTVQFTDSETPQNTINYVVNVN